MTTQRPHTLTLPDGSTWPAPQPTTALSTGTSWKLRYRPARDLTPNDIGHAADVIDAYSRLCTATPKERNAIIEALRADLEREPEETAG